MGLFSASAVIRFRGIPAELPRYRHQRLRWTAAGFRSEAVPMQLEIFWQGLLNASVLAVPAVLLAFGPSSDRPLGPVEVAGFALWVVAWAGEAVADRQKRRYVAEATRTGDRKGTCQVGR